MVYSRTLPNSHLPRIPTYTVPQTTLHRDAPVRILGLRVEFVADTLSTTTGNGKFAYHRSDALYNSFNDDEEIVLDPPPHDSLFFTDQLMFLNNYFQKISNGEVSLVYDIFPAGERSAYQLPKQMWQYNWNYSGAQLDTGLAQLFKDAVNSADKDTTIIWQNYDLVIVFHAGAGKEFDLGYRTTPHDIPSAWMVKSDFERYLNLPRGIPVDNETHFITGGLILPETESHDGVQIAMCGVICMLFGHWLGLPALYDKDDGRPVVGKWSLMDRAWGNFYGAVPGPVDAWSAAYKGWLTPMEIIEPGGYQIASRFRESAELPPISKVYKISITFSEYFILENRDRDPERDSLCYGFDRFGDTMLVFYEDYTVKRYINYNKPLKPIVNVDNIDFDTPGSGILIWHIDETLLPLIEDGRFNSLNTLRGLDLEEADGAQDIGQNYPFLTPGYGTDYGIFEDAWYADNDAHISANGGRYVMFNNNSFPNSRSNKGALTHIRLDSLSRRLPVMGFRFNNDALRFNLPTPFTIPDELISRLTSVVGNFDLSSDDQEFAVISDTLFIYNGNGNILNTISISKFPVGETNFPPIVRDFNGDGLDEIIWLTQELQRNINQGNTQFLIAAVSQVGGDYIIKVLDRIDISNLGLLKKIHALALGTPYFNSKLLLIISLEDHSLLREYNNHLDLNNECNINSEVIAAYRFGCADSDSALLITQDTDILLWSNANLNHLGQINPNGRIGVTISTPILADFDRSGSQDLFFITTRPNFNYYLISNIAQNGLNTHRIFTPSALINKIQPLFPIDLGKNGQYEILGLNEGKVSFVSYNGYFAENAPKLNYNNINNIVVVDLNRDGNFDFLYEDIIDYPLTPHGDGQTILRGLDHTGKPLYGLPIELGKGGHFKLIQPDTTGRLMLLAVNLDRILLYDMNYRGRKEDIWWQGQYRDNDHSNAVWELVNPFNPPSNSPLMPSDLCYCWPNPAREATAIRYFLNEPAQITITIYDISGSVVTKINTSGQAGLPNEIIWELKDIARGGYYAVVEAKSANRTERKVVKIAVVK